VSEDSARISPTAHYTGHVWARNGLGHPLIQGAARSGIYTWTKPAMLLLSLLAGGMTLEKMLIQRHRVLDALLTRAIEERGVGQVVEIAGGLSARGLRFVEAYADRGLVYVEADLPGMVAHKRAAMRGPSPAGHHLLHIDALADDGPASLAAACAPLMDPSRPCAVVTEGLINYFDEPTVEAMWARFERFLAGFPEGVYLTNARLAGGGRGLPRRVVRAAIQAIVRGQTYEQYASPEALSQALLAAGFGEVSVTRAADWTERLGLPAGKTRQRLVEAWR